jgi:Fe-S oxidoreductase
MRDATVDSRALERVEHIVESRKELVKLSLTACAHCSLCADSCFLYRSSGRDPRWSPAYKAINSIGTLARTRGQMSAAKWQEVRELVFDRCVLCTRCRCPVGINIPSLIAAARAACREAGIQRWYTTRRNA